VAGGWWLVAGGRWAAVSGWRPEISWAQWDQRQTRAALAARWLAHCNSGKRRVQLILVAQLSGAASYLHANHQRRPAAHSTCAAPFLPALATRLCYTTAGEQIAPLRDLNPPTLQGARTQTLEQLASLAVRRQGT